ncbi:ABC transporter ATP-binding protein [Phyllobacterium sp. SB3]|uniref:ABC transporter ATP-binding protein n=1 Tax=Phyllobacterium sp. SB3 TaxID=3156073 RepID=UPI0032AEEB8E
MTILSSSSRRYVPVYIVLVLFSAAMRAMAALLLIPLLSALFSSGPGAAVPWLGYLTAVVAAGWAAEWRLVILAFDLGFDAVRNINDKLIDHLLAVPIGWLGARQQAEAKTALAGAVPELFPAFVNLGGQIGISIVLPAMIGLGLLFIAWPLGVVALCGVPLLLGSLVLGARLMRRAEADFSTAAEEVAERTDEFASAQAVLRSAGRTGLDGTPLGAAIDSQRHTGLRMLWFTVPGTLVFSLSMQLVLVAMIAALATSFATGRIDAVQSVALIVAITRYLEPFTVLSNLFPALETARGAWKRTADIFAAPLLHKPERDAQPGPATIEFRNVSFGQVGKRILEDISFAVEAGTTTAIIGPSGAGKSTILSLVARFHEVDAGEVCVCGQDVRDYLPGTLMEQLAIVFQNVQLFEGSIADNIRIAHPDASDEQVREAGRVAGVEEIIERLGGWDAAVGEGGSNLSGGERQRVSIARALLKNAPVLLLDEATSSLDTANEAAITAALQRLSSHTVLIVAHRVETIAHADHIVFVENGRIVEAGPRETLIAEGGYFARYWGSRRAARIWKLETARTEPIQVA